MMMFDPLLFANKKALLIDMNGTFMFGGDRFRRNEDYSLHYRSIGGELSRSAINAIINGIYEFMALRYSDRAYQDAFPSIETAIDETVGQLLPEEERDRIVSTFAHHELGFIPPRYANVLEALHHRFSLAAVIDIWSPKTKWVAAFEEAGIDRVFAATSFSSDHGHVKPSRFPYDRMLDDLGMTSNDALVIGDSPERDLAGSRAAGIDCILVGGATHPDAVAVFENLLELGAWMPPRSEKIADASMDRRG